ncbi:MAG TPA: hypothetical protein VG891_11735 [Rhizomicrobium sp.]|nr:hypothetical protein [Rhizomicrobium sp.]
MRFLSAKAAASSLLGVLCVAAIALDWPGHLSNDSVLELLEGRTGRYESWHPAITSWLLGLADSLTGNAGLFVVFTTALLYAALLLLVRIPRRASWLALPAILLCAATPQFFLYPGYVWKDVLFAESAVAGFACLAFAAARWQQSRQRLAFTVLSIFLLALAALARQNGIAAALMAIPACFLIARRNAAGTRAALMQAFLYLLTLIVVVAVSTVVLDSRGDHGRGKADEIKMLQLYDFAAVAHRDPAFRFEDLEARDPVFARLIRSDGARLFSPERVDTLAGSQRLGEARDDAPAGLMTEQWLDIVTRHLPLYLNVRAGIFRWVFLTPDIDRCVPFIVGVFGPSEILQALHMKPRSDRRDAAIESYAQFFVGTPVFSHAFFALIGIAVVVFLLRRRSAPDIAIIFLLAASAAFALTFFSISLACDYRYLYFLDVASMAGAIYAVGSRRSAASQVSST